VWLDGDREKRDKIKIVNRFRALKKVKIAAVFQKLIFAANVLNRKPFVHQNDEPFPPMLKQTGKPNTELRTIISQNRQ
jgi:UDP-N-acetylglucosamine pyrophosphorylase